MSAHFLFLQARVSEGTVEGKNLALFSADNATTCNSTWAFPEGFPKLRVQPVVQCTSTISGGDASIEGLRSRLDELVYGGHAQPWDAKARSKAVAAALVTVLWRAAAAAAEERGGPPVATLCVLAREPCAADAAAALRPDGVTERLSLRSCASPEELERLVASQAVQRLYEARHGPGARWRGHSHSSLVRGERL